MGVWLWSRGQQAANEQVLASCTDEEKGGLTCRYMEQGAEIMPYIWACAGRLPALPRKQADEDSDDDEEEEED